MVKHFADKQDDSRAAFTLLEMSIVLMVIGLIAGGIYVGQSMIRQSQIQGVVKEVTQYRQAVTDFYDKYHALPGDFTGATALWGAANSDPTTCWVTPVYSGTATCDGDGNGWVGNVQFADISYQHEPFNAWQHLANAGMIGGRYTGVPGPLSTVNDQPGINVPASSIPGAGYRFTALTADQALMGSTMHQLFYTQYNTVLQFGLPDFIGGSVDNPVLSPEEGLAVDSKIDDGLPGSGNMLAWAKLYTPNCATSNDPATAVYNVSQSGPQCVFMFLLGL